jgi:hypothetical protein
MVLALAMLFAVTFKSDDAAFNPLSATLKGMLISQTNSK